MIQETFDQERIYFNADIFSDAVCLKTSYLIWSLEP